MTEAIESVWPYYAHLRDAECWRCGCLLDSSTLRESGYGRGNGEYQGRCPRCRGHTWFNSNERIKK